MFLLGIVIALTGAALVLIGLFGTTLTNSGDLHVIGIDVTAPTLFLLGVVAALLVLLGLWVAKSGAKRGWRQRKEQKKYEELGEKLGRANRDREFDENDRR